MAVWQLANFGQFPCSPSRGRRTKSRLQMPLAMPLAARRSGAGAKRKKGVSVVFDDAVIPDSETSRLQLQTAHHKRGASMAVGSGSGAAALGLRAASDARRASTKRL